MSGSLLRMGPLHSRSQLLLVRLLALGPSKAFYHRKDLRKDHRKDHCKGLPSNSRSHLQHSSNPLHILFKLDRYRDRRLVLRAELNNRGSVRCKSPWICIRHQLHKHLKSRSMARYQSLPDMERSIARDVWNQLLLHTTWVRVVNSYRSSAQARSSSQSNPGSGPACHHVKHRTESRSNSMDRRTLDRVVKPKRSRHIPPSLLCLRTLQPQVFQPVAHIRIRLTLNIL